MTDFIQETEQGFTIRVFVQPRSSKNMLAGSHGDALKIKLTAPPVDGAANKMCVAFLAKHLGLSKSSVEIVAGQTSRTKIVLIHADTTDKTALPRLRQHIENTLIGTYPK
jgi:uncharacterized protein (TIGR00251 family)